MFFPRSLVTNTCILSNRQRAQFLIDLQVEASVFSSNEVCLSVASNSTYAQIDKRAHRGDLAGSSVILQGAACEHCRINWTDPIFSATQLEAGVTFSVTVLFRWSTQCCWNTERILKTASKITGHSHQPRSSIFKVWRHRRALNIVRDDSHAAALLCKEMTSERRFRQICFKSEQFKRNTIPEAAQ